MYKLNECRGVICEVQDYTSAYHKTEYNKVYQFTGKEFRSFSGIRIKRLHILQCILTSDDSELARSTARFSNEVDRRVAPDKVRRCFRAERAPFARQRRPLESVGAATETSFEDFRLAVVVVVAVAASCIAFD